MHRLGAIYLSVTSLLIISPDAHLLPTLVIIITSIVYPPLPRNISTIKTFRFLLSSSCRSTAVSSCSIRCAAHPVRVICFSLTPFAVGCGGRLLPKLETCRSSHCSLVPIYPHVIHHYYRWLSWYTPHYLDQTPLPPLPLLFPVITSNPAIGDNAEYVLRHTTRERLFGSICRSECSLGSFATTATVFRI